MKYVIASLSLLAASCAFGAKSTDLTDLSKPLLLTHPGKFSVYLPSNPTTGYQWFLSTPHAPWLKIVTSGDVKAKAPQTMGAPGMYAIDLDALPSGFVAPSVTTIKLTYMRPWELAGKKEVKLTIITHKNHRGS